MTTNTLEVINTVSSKLDGYFNMISEKIGVGADHFWPILIKQQIINGITDLTIVIVLWTLSILIFNVCRKNFNVVCQLHRNQHPERDDSLFKYGISVAFTSVMTFILTYNLSYFLNQILNPESIIMTNILKVIQ